MNLRNFTTASIAALIVLAAFAPPAQAGSMYSDTVLADSPVGYWRLDETSGPAVNQGSGTGLNGTYNNFPTGVRGVPGLINANANAAANFNGSQSASGSTVTGSGVNTSDAGSNPFANDWTIEAWFVRDTQNTWSAIFSNNNGSTAGPVMTFINATHQLGINGTGVTANNVSIDLGAGSLGDEVYAVITKTGGNAASTANLTVYANVDGTWLTPATGTNVGWALTPGNGYYIGRHYTADTQLHDGIIDEVAIYNYALTQDDVFAHFNAGASFVTPEPSTALAVVFGLVAFVSRRGGRGRFGNPFTARCNSVAASMVVLVAFAGLASQAQAGSMYSDTVLADSPVGYWRLDETSGPALNQGSGTGLNGTYNNFPTGVRGVPGLINANANAAANFNGSQSASGSAVAGSGVNTSDAGNNPFANDWTIEAWFVRDTQNDWSAIFSNNNGSSTAPVMTFVDGTHQLGINGTGVTPNNVSVDLGAGSLGEKVYAVITKTGGNADSASSLTVYANVDGTWMTPATGTNVGWTLTPGDGYFIGRHFSGDTQFHDGIIDEVAIYNYALTQDDVFAHFNAGASFVTPEPSTALAVVVGLVAIASRRHRRGHA